jgi:hypothetical protein
MPAAFPFSQHASPIVSPTIQSSHDKDRSTLFASVAENGLEGVARRCQALGSNLFPQVCEAIPQSSRARLPPCFGRRPFSKYGWRNSRRARKTRGKAQKLWPPGMPIFPRSKDRSPIFRCKSKAGSRGSWQTAPSSPHMPRCRTCRESLATQAGCPKQRQSKISIFLSRSWLSPPHVDSQSLRIFNRPPNENCCAA